MVGDGESDNTGDSKRVPALVVLQRGLCIDVPAPPRFWCLTVDDDEILVLIGKVGILCATKIGLCRSRAVVEGDDEGGTGDDVRGLVDKGPNVGWVGAKIPELTELIHSAQNTRNPKNANKEEFEGDRCRHGGALCRETLCTMFKFIAVTAWRGLVLSLLATGGPFRATRDRSL